MIKLVGKVVEIKNIDERYEAVLEVSRRSDVKDYISCLFDDKPELNTYYKIDGELITVESELEEYKTRLKVLVTYALEVDYSFMSLSQKCLNEVEEECDCQFFKMRETKDKKLTEVICSFDEDMPRFFRALCWGCYAERYQGKSFKAKVKGRIQSRNYYKEGKQYTVCEVSLFKIKRISY